MQVSQRRLSRVACLVGLYIVALPIFAAQGADQGQTPHSSTAPAAHEADRDEPPNYTTRSLRGRIVWLAEALHRRFGIETDRDAARSMVALETDAGELYPIVKDDRGRGFWLDERLRGIDLELRVRRFTGSPLIQVVRVYTWEGEKKFELDYWCDICAIPMYELKPCECCQGPTRFRRRAVAADRTQQETTLSGGGLSGPSQPAD